MSKKIAKAKQIQYKQWLKANPRIAQAGSAQLRAEEKIRRNSPCPCESGIKYKKCCGPPLYRQLRLQRESKEDV